MPKSGAGLPVRDLLRKRVYEHVSELIVRGELRPGEKIVEDRLSRGLSVSRTPVREALRLLESEGYLRVVPHRGAVVAAISRGEAENIYALVSALEGLAVGLATPALTPRDLGRLASVNRRLGGIAKRGDIGAYFALNKVFHAVVLDKCPNALVLEQISRFWNRISRYRLVSLSAPQRLGQSVKEHARLLRAIRAGNAETARSLHECHVRNGGKAVLDMLATLPAPIETEILAR